MDYMEYLQRIAVALERIANATEAMQKRFHEETKIGGALDARYATGSAAYKSAAGR